MIKSIFDYLCIAKSGLFDSKYYLTMYPDVLKADMNPLWHFVRNGWKEGRNPSALFNTNIYLLRNPEIRRKGENPLIHFLRHRK